ncbi:MAG: phage baseplate assembly protein [Janthinobacterium lividum]
MSTTVPDDVTITTGGKIIGGWQAVRITRGIERMPSDFDIALTELYPGAADQIVIQPGAPCVVKLGADVVVTGYVDRYVPSISARGHGVRIQGRGKCQDLVDCSAGFRPDGTHSFQRNVTSALSFAQELAKPFGISATLIGEEAGGPIPTIVINIGETLWEIVERIGAYRQLLAYEGADGNLILAQGQDTKAGSGFALGTNIEAATATFSADQRYSDFYVTWTSTDDLFQVREDTGGVDGNLHAHVTDPTVTRFRPHGIISTQVDRGVDIGTRRATWEMNRRNGRSQSISLTCDNWRDSAGALWQPNTLATVDAQILKLPGKTWLISEVTYRRDDNGTHADLVLMPPDAFALAPSSLQGSDWQTFDALRASRAAGVAGAAGPRNTNPAAVSSGTTVNLITPPDP